ncbi:DUF3006 domain-containing protein [Acetobacterium wieringae]|uniref:DUF3006 domain-containing protein n=1 Tax=Acetobacterium wieringae TaxID=52694 RepID=UPI0026F13D63|nr:DUF3006 domain-containing protein [Acetobacterium wieringae]
MKVIIDRFEGDYAVCEKEDRKMIDIQKAKIPVDAKEGDVLEIDNDQITIDVAATKKRKLELENLAKNLWK